jgi:polysaccharide export outer membrane protein
MINLLMVGIVISGLGCRSSFTARSLPPEFMASRVVNTRQIDVARLRAPAVQSNIVYPGDALDIVVAASAADEDANPVKVRVANDGFVVLPMVGPLRLAGLSLAESENVIRMASIQRGFYRQPAVGVQLQSRQINRVNVSGAVNSPGPYELPSAASNLREAILAAGGLSEHADVFVDFSGPSQNGNVANQFGGGRVDLVALTQAEAQSPYLVDGTTVFVHRKPDRYIRTIGLIGNKTVEIPPNQDFRLLDALAQAGGPEYSHWVADKVTVIRQVPGSNETINIKTSIQSARTDTRENLLLAPGDIVSVDENPITFTLGTLNKVLGLGVSAAQIGSLAP